MIYYMRNMTRNTSPHLTLTSSGDTDVALERRTTSHDTDDTRWKVIAHDDDVTTMEFVVRIMVQIFKKPLILAEAIMWQVHTEGQSVVDVLPRAEAERRVSLATAAARLEGFPFRFTLEPENL
jgi:ATP-dependent Clp protease adaptor protein ClpS